MTPDLTVFWVIFFVLLSVLILDGLVLKPILRVIDERERAVKSARELAARSAAEVQAAVGEYETKTAAARSEIYRQLDVVRRQAFDRRTALLGETRRQAEAQIAEATARLRQQAGEARVRLDRDAAALADAIVERVLGRKTS